MILLATALALSLSQQIDIDNGNRSHDATAATRTCGIKVAGYRFAGERGREFRYGRTTYTIPSEGYVELISARPITTYDVDGQQFALGAGKTDPFGMHPVTLPVSSASVGGGK